MPPAVGFPPRSFRRVINSVTFQVTFSDPLSAGAALQLNCITSQWQGGMDQGYSTVPAMLASAQHGTFEIKNVLGDGRCLFRALAVLINGDQHNYQGLIDKIVAHIIHDWQAFKTYITLGHRDQRLELNPESYRSYMQYGKAFDEQPAGPQQKRVRLA